MKSLITSTLLLLALLLPATAAAYDFEVDGIYYNINGNEAVVTSSPSNDQYRGDVTIPEAVTYNGTTYSVTVIGERAFENCSSLKSVSIPNSVITIERIALWGCRGLTSIIIPNSVISIGREAFFGCSGLSTIIVDSGNPTYDSRDNCNAIIQTASNTLVTGCKNTVIPNTVTAIGNDAFEGCKSLTSITIPSSVTAIGNSAFGFCYSLTNVNIPNSVTSIGSYVFYHCSSLTSMTIPNSVTFIGLGVFSSCDNLASITVESGNQKYDSRNNCNAIIETASNTLIAGCKSTVIPNSVTSIDECAFQGCSGLTSIDIPNSVRFIGRDAFHSCRNLKSVTFGNSLTTIDYYAFDYCSSLTSVIIPNSVTFIGLGVFSSCSSLTSIIVDSGNLIYDSRDNCNAIIETSSNSLIAGCQNTVIPNVVTSISGWAFDGCSGLTSITIPKSVTSIGSSAFFDCIHLSEVYSFIVDPSAISMASSAFYQNPGGSDYSYRTLHVPQGTAAAYQADENWYPYFGQIVEDLMPDDLRGDVNGDGNVNITDINVVVDIILGAALDDETMQRADVNGDGSINISDVNAIINIIVGGGEEPVFEPEWVDLGLQSGTLWATCNVGASKPEEYGDLFAWGETAPKKFYAFQNYKWCDGTEDSLTKYCSADGKRELDPEDDAAYVNWGPSWRMPTASQQSELMLNCIWQWTQQNGVNGYLVKGANGNSIFLPAAGEGFYSRINDVGSEGSYWSREGVTLANGIGFDSEEKFWIAGARAYGRSVRAVRVP